MFWAYCVYVKHKIIYISNIMSLLLITNIKTKEGNWGSYLESPAFENEELCFETICFLKFLRFHKFCNRVFFKKG